MSDKPEIGETLDEARALLRTLIESYQESEPTGPQAAALMKMLVHVVNMQKAVDTPFEDSNNLGKRLRDFANIIDRLEMPNSGSPELKAQLTEKLRLAADVLGSKGVRSAWTAEYKAATPAT